MRLKKNEITQRKIIDSFIDSCSTVRLGLISDDMPYIVPVNFIYLNGAVHFHCAFEGRKYSCLEAGGTICLEFDRTHGIDIQRASTFYTSVIAWGTPLMISDRGRKKDILERLCVKYLGEKRKITDTMADGTCVVSVKLDTVTGKENRA